MSRRAGRRGSLGTDTWSRLYRARILATIYTGITRVGYFLLWIVPSGAISVAIGPEDRGLVLAMVLGYSLMASAVSRAQGKRAFAPVLRWLDEAREPTVAEQKALLEQPRLHAFGTFAYWAVGGLIGAVVYAVEFEPDGRDALLLFCAVSCLGLHAGAFSYLLVERTLRPVAAVAMATSHPVRLSILSVKNRFLMAFVFGPGITIAGISILLTLRAAAPIDLAPAVWPVVVLGIVDGYLLVSLAAASVTEPMEQIRVAMKRVFEGDLHADVPVDAGSEVGLLQVGFNRMLGGLRERELLRQLLGRSTGNEVAAQLVAQGADFEGVEVEASVLMVDLIGSTPLTEENAADVLATLNTLFGVVVETTNRHGGIVNRFVGDAAVCLFGAPVPCVNHASAALAAARGLHDELVVLRKERPWLDVGIGVSSGAVIAASVGTDSRFEFTVIGDAANEAARLTEVAKKAPARLVASGTSIESASADEASLWVVASEVQLRGKRRKTVVYEPLGSLAAQLERLDEVNERAISFEET